MCADHLHYIGQTFPSKEFIKQEILILKQEHAAKIQSLQNAKEANEVLDSVPGMSDLKTDDATTKQADVIGGRQASPVSRCCQITPCIDPAIPGWAESSFVQASPPRW